MCGNMIYHLSNMSQLLNCSSCYVVEAASLRYFAYYIGFTTLILVVFKSTVRYVTCFYCAQFLQSPIDTPHSPPAEHKISDYAVVAIQYIGYSAGYGIIQRNYRI